MATSPHLLVIGCGSVGKRHARNLQSLGARISGVDPREDRRLELSKEVGGCTVHATLGDALSHQDTLNGVIVASPTAYHAEQAGTALDTGLPVLLEKPVASDLTSANGLATRLDNSGCPLLLGYTWRWWPAVRRLKSLVDDGTAGRLIHVRFTMSAHLADWHPWEDYRDWFMASREQGGGALLDESHWIDLALWLFGQPDKVFGRIETISGLEIDSDDNVDALLVYDSGLRVSLHLDLYGRPHERSICLVGDEATLSWSADDDRILIGRDAQGFEPLAEFQNERNDMFMGVGREFLEVIDGDRAPSCTLADGIQVLEVIEALRISSQTERMASLPLSSVE